MNVDAMKRLFAHNRWATEQILNAAENLTVEQFRAHDDTPFGSIRNELVHILDTQLGWVERIQVNMYQRTVVTGDLDPETYPDVDSVKALQEQVEESSSAFLETIAGDQLTDMLTFDFEWGDISAPLWELLAHIVIHGTQHRSEVAMKLTNFGHSPGMLDLLFSRYADESWEEGEIQPV